MFVVDVKKERDHSIRLEDRIHDYIDWCNRCYDYEYVSGVKKFIDDMVKWFNGQFDLSFEGYLKMTLYGLPSCPNISDIDIESFISSYEVNYLKRPMYDTEKTFNLVEDGSHEFSLTSFGRVRDHKDAQFELYDNDGNLHKFNDVPVEELLKWIKDENICVYIKDINTLYDEIEKYNCDSIFKDSLLDTVMYKLIESGSLFGTLEGYIFAKKFNRDTSIPLTYGIADMKDYEIKKTLIKDYLNNNGDTNLECYVGYFDNDKNQYDIYTKSLADVMQELGMQVENQKPVTRKRS